MAPNRNRYQACLLLKPETHPYFRLAPGERVDLWLDFSGRTVGSQLLVPYSLPFSDTQTKMAEKMKDMVMMSVMLDMAHPIHIHGQQYQVLRRIPKMVRER
jgi:FtsP/CotA-like multicopper oxidase with cupredoxin domain